MDATARSGGVPPLPGPARGRDLLRAGARARTLGADEDRLRGAQQRCALDSGARAPARHPRRPSPRGRRRGARLPAPPARAGSTLNTRSSRSTGRKAAPRSSRDTCPSCAVRPPRSAFNAASSTASLRVRDGADRPSPLSPPAPPPSGPSPASGRDRTDQKVP